MNDNNSTLVTILERWFHTLEWLIIRAALSLLLLYEVAKFVAGQWHGPAGQP